MLGTLLHALPLYGSILSTAGYALPYLFYLPGRCMLESAIPGQSQRYRGLLAALERVHFWRARPQAGTHAGAEGSWGDMRGCMAVSFWLALYVGALLPCWVLGLVEAQAWRRWQRRPGLSTACLALHVCCMALASTACLFLAEQAA